MTQTWGPADSDLLLSPRECTIIPVGNQNGWRYEAKTIKGRLTGHASVDGPKDSRSSGTAARLWNRPAHRADQRRSAGRESGHSVSGAVEAGARRRHRVRVGASENNRRARFYRLRREGRKQLQIETQDWEQSAAIIGRFFEAKAEDLS